MSTLACHWLAAEAGDCADDVSGVVEPVVDGEVEDDVEGEVDGEVDGVVVEGEVDGVGVVRAGSLGSWGSLGRRSQAVSASAASSAAAAAAVRVCNFMKAPWCMDARIWQCSFLPAPSEFGREDALQPRKVHRLAQMHVEAGAQGLLDVQVAAIT